MYDASIGRWNGVDALADDPLQIKLTPYNYTWGNPIKLNDPDGNCPFCLNLLKGGIEGAIEFGSQMTIGMTVEGKSFADALYDVAWEDVGVATVAGALSPTPGSGRLAVMARRTGKALNGVTGTVLTESVDVTIEGGFTSNIDLSSGEAAVGSIAEVGVGTVLDHSADRVVGSVADNVVGDFRNAASTDMLPSNLAPMTKEGKEQVRNANSLVNSESFEQGVDRTTNFLYEAGKKVVSPGGNVSAPSFNFSYPTPTAPNDATMVQPPPRLP